MKPEPDPGARTVVFDGVCFGDGPPTGVGRAFTTALRAYADAHDDRRCVLLLPHGAQLPDELHHPRLQICEAPRGRLRRQLLLPRLLRRIGARLLHSSVAAVPLAAPCPTIATVHDLPWLHPELAEPDPSWRRFATARSLRRAARVLAPSALTARDAATLLGGHDATIVLVPHATPLPADAPPAAERRTGPLLVLGDDRPRKNRARLERAHRAASARRRELPPLQFVGPPDAYTSEADKRALLRHCRALVHVSRFEGFGLPVLEGLAHGAPVLCSDLPPHREIAGDAAHYVPADDEAAIADALLAIDADASLRDRLVAAGPPRAAAFSPARIARRWREVHDEVLR